MSTYKQEIIEWNEAIRKRPAMYVGDLYFSGFVNMLEYLLDEIIEDCIGNAIIQFDFFEENNILITILNADFEKATHRLNSLNEENSYFSLGYRVLISLSSKIDVFLNYNSVQTTLQGNKGDYFITTSNFPETKECLKIKFSPDFEIFKFKDVLYDHINAFLRKFAYLNTQVRIISIDNKKEYQRNIFHYENGVKQQLDFLIAQKLYSHPKFRLDLKQVINEYNYQISFCYQDLWLVKSYIKSYANNTETYLGGSLVDGIIEGIIKSIKQIAASHNINININKNKVAENLIIIAAVKGDNFDYKGSTKWLLDKPGIKKDMKKFVFEQTLQYLQTNRKEAEEIVTKFAN